MPESHLPSPDRRAAWESGSPPTLLAGGKSASAQAWIFQTFIELHTCADVKLSTVLPDHGVVVTLANFLPTGFRAPPDLFIAAVVADFVPHPGTQLSIVQNAAHARRLPRSIFLRHWPQPGLLPRRRERGDALERVAFFGDPSNLAPELASPEFARRLHQSTGAILESRAPARWADFSDVDVALAIRDFSGAQHLNKPATKLYNAWLAGVPLLTGRDSAYRAEATNGSDYQIARSPDHAIEVIASWRNNPSIRNAIVENGHKKTALCSRDAVRRQWKDFCTQELPARAEEWFRRSPVARTRFWLAQRMVFWLDRHIRS